MCNLCFLTCLYVLLVCVGGVCECVMCVTIVLFQGMEGFALVLVFFSSLVVQQLSGILAFSCISSIFVAVI